MSPVHQRAGWNDPARGLADRLARLLWPEEFDGGPTQQWDSAAEYLETVGSVLNDYGERATADAESDEHAMRAQLGLGTPSPDVPEPDPRAGSQVVLSGRQVASLYGMRKAGRRFVLHVLSSNLLKGDEVEIEASGSGRVKVCQFGPDGALRSTGR